MKLLKSINMSMTHKEAMQLHEEGEAEKALLFFPEKYLRTESQSTEDILRTITVEEKMCFIKKHNAKAVLMGLSAKAWHEEYEKDEISRDSYVIVSDKEENYEILKVANKLPIGTVTFPSMETALTAYNTLVKKGFIEYL